MAENADFREFYLREIGVAEPLAQFVGRNVPLTAEMLQASDTATVSHTEQIPDAPVVETVVRVSSTLDELASRASTCTACALSEGRNQVVFGVGNPHADIVFIGEAPGREEDLKGEPFVGRAGQLLDRMLTAIGLDRSQVYIMNTVKCRPPHNRDPRPEEVEACSRWFDAQLSALSPKMICLLGRVAAQTVLESDAPLSALRGKWHRYHGIPVRVLYHPAFLLRSPQQKSRAWSDLCTLMKGA